MSERTTSGGHVPPTGLSRVDRAGRSEFSLDGLLTCAGCDRRLVCLQTLSGRAYGAPCGCRPGPVNAEKLECLVLDAVVAHGRGMLIQIEDAADQGSLMCRFLAEVYVGNTIDELEFSWLY
ncbi:hypothetical protein [Micromonospora sp. LOL_021]|uniref:hypothetical protein n=1 Tax=Micromonospora sp. LOL_021 TaxID=3345417 RepID=UPI003A8C8032